MDSTDESSADSSDSGDNNNSGSYSHDERSLSNSTKTNKNKSNSGDLSNLSDDSLPVSDSVSVASCLGSELESDSDLSASTSQRTGGGPGQRRSRGKGRFRDRKSRRQYFRWIEAELELVRGLEQQYGDDLAVHLYGTHRLRRYLDHGNEGTAGGGEDGREEDRGFSDELYGDNRREGEDGERGEASGDDIDDISNNPLGRCGNGRKDRTKSGKRTKPKPFPPRRWSAWPLPPELVPSVDERFGVPGDDPDGLDAWTARGPRAGSPQSVLAEVLTAVVLRKAKEKLRAEQHQAAVSNEIKANNSRSRGEGDNEESQLSHTQSKRDSKLTLGLRKSDVTHLVMKADDEQSIEILQPKIDSLLTDFDGLLLALVKSQRRRPEPSNKSKLKRRKRSREPRPNREHDEKLKGRKGRPLSHEKPREGESYYMMRKRLSLSRERPSNKHTNERYISKAKTESSRSDSPSHASSSSSSASSASPRTKYADLSSDGSESQDKRQDSGSRHTAQRRYYNRNVRGWMEVLEIAKRSGWKPETVDRAATRCAVLFKDGTM